jgi:hypothetical protein
MGAEEQKEKESKKWTQRNVEWEKTNTRSIIVSENGKEEREESCAEK